MGIKSRREVESIATRLSAYVAKLRFRYAILFAGYSLLRDLIGFTTAALID
jgi:hypothetical protein